MCSSDSDTNWQPHLLVSINKLETISALAHEVNVLSRSHSFFPICPFGAIIRLGANGQVLNGNTIISDAIPDPRSIILFAAYSYPQFLPQDDTSGQIVGQNHSVPQHMIYDQSPTLNGNSPEGITPVEPILERAEKGGRGEEIRAVSSTLVSDPSTSQSPGPAQQPFQARVESKFRSDTYRAEWVDPATYTPAMAQDVSGASCDAAVFLLNAIRLE